MSEALERSEAHDTAAEGEGLASAARRVMLRAAQLSDIGAVRERNEDSCLVFTSDSGGYLTLRPCGFFLVADGMGGHYAGDQASMVASRVVTSHVIQHIYEPLVRDDLTAGPTEIEEILSAAVLAAHEAVYDPDPMKNGGTTLTAALILDDQVYLAHVGDSRAYWLRDGRLQPITRDHSLVQRLLDNGQLSSSEAQDYQYRNVLLRALGQEDDLVVDTSSYLLPLQGKLLLCSDGLCGQVADSVIESCLNQPLPPDALAQQLIDAALAAGGPDNITAVVVEFTF
jgi:serine/threonine protein phosphatase PrpC